MNWKEIKEEYPKAFEQLIVWVNCENNGSQYGEMVFDKDVEYWLPIGSIRWLYDFFDSFPIFVVLEQFDDGDFYAVVRLYENYEDGKFAQDGHLDWEWYEGKDSESGIFENRLDAEIDGFEQAFKLLDNIF